MDGECEFWLMIDSNGNCILYPDNIQSNARVHAHAEGWLAGMGNHTG